MPIYTLSRRARATVAAIGAAVALSLTGGATATATRVERATTHLVAERDARGATVASSELGGCARVRRDAAPVRPPLKPLSLAQNPATAWRPPTSCELTAPESALIATPAVTVTPSSVPEGRTAPSAGWTTGQGVAPVTRPARGLDGGAPVFAAGMDDSPARIGLDEQAQRDLAVVAVTAAIGLGLALAARRMRARRRD